MAHETPKWLQAGSYAARLDRHVIQELFRGKNRVLRGLQVTQRAAGANFSVDVSAGSAVVMGTTQADQGGYICRSTAVDNFTSVGATPASNRTDGLYLVVNDPNAGGPAGDNFTFVYVNGGSAAPADSLLLANIARAPGESAILAAAITDMRPLGEWSWTVGTVPPSGLAPDGDLYVQVS